MADAGWRLRRVVLRSGWQHAVPDQLQRRVDRPPGNVPFAVGGPHGGQAGVVDDIEDGRSQRERMLSGDLYLADDPELASAQLRARRLQDRFNRSAAEGDAERRAILHELLREIGPGSEIRPPFNCDYGVHIRVGARVFANYGLVALDVAPITIGDDVQIGPYVQLLTPTHPVDPALRRAKWETAQPIVIEQNAWIGGGAIVLPGVTVGENAVVGAGAVITRDVGRNVIVGGNPARIIRSL